MIKVDRAVIRKAQLKDMDQLIQLCQEHAEYERSEYNPKGKFVKLTALIFSDQAPVNCVVAESEGQLIGYVTFMKQFSTWDAAYYVYMDCLFLRETARGQGIGKELMRSVVRFARDEYCSQVQWHTPDFNHRAIKFYRDYGAISKTKERFFLDLK